MRELELQQKRGELLSRKELVVALSQMITNARATLLQMPAKLAPRLASLSSVVDVEEVIRKEVYAALEQLSHGIGASPEVAP